MLLRQLRSKIAYEYTHSPKNDQQRSKKRYKEEAASEKEGIDP